MTPTPARPINRRLLWWLAAGVWRQQPGALLAAVVAVALGVALASGVHWVNGSALAAFSRALATINGQADIRVAARVGLLADSRLEEFERMIHVRAASPLIESELLATLDGQSDVRLKLVALDVFRASSINPGWLATFQGGTPRRATQSNENDNGQGGDARSLLADGAVFVSTGATHAFGAEIADTLTIRTVQGAHRLRIAGTVGQKQAGDERLAVMDIAAAQQLLDMAGQLTRIDLRLTQDTDRDSFMTLLRERFPDLLVSTVDDERTRMSNLSLAYRVNLNVLALVALLTGGFIVQATMSLAVGRLASSFALLGLVGTPAIFSSRVVILLALIIGLAGSIAGLLLGALLAWALLGLVGADLGGGYFSSGSVALHLDPFAAIAFVALGVTAALAGTYSPRQRLRTIAPVQALKGGLIASSATRSSRLWIALLMAALAGVALQLPPLGTIPLGAYAAMALTLLAGVTLIAPLLGRMSQLMRARAKFTWRWPAAWLAIARLADQPAAAAVALAGVVASFALVTAMAVMVHSFRSSVDNWLDAVLPADLYISAQTSGERGGLDPARQQTLASLNAVAKVEFLSTSALVLDEDAPPLRIIARPIDAKDPQASLPITGSYVAASGLPPDCLAIYISEAAQLRMDWNVGQRLNLPIGNAPCFTVAGIWRDYARQHGAIAIDRQRYQQLTGDNAVNSAAISLRDGTSIESFVAELERTGLPIDSLDMRSSGEIRALSLSIFDRSFALTYALEIIALVVGLFGVATTFAGEAQARVREFGMLRHLGFTSGQIRLQFASEATLAIGAGVALGAGLGALLAQVLIHWVNPQSFHWKMQTSWPLMGLFGAALLLIVIGVLAATWSARRAASTAPIAAVRADW